MESLKNNGNKDEGNSLKYCVLSFLNTIGSFESFFFLMNRVR